MLCWFLSSFLFFFGLGSVAKGSGTRKAPLRAGARAAVFGSGFSLSSWLYESCVVPSVLLKSTQQERQKSGRASPPLRWSYPKPAPHPPPAKKKTKNPTKTNKKNKQRKSERNANPKREPKHLTCFTRLAHQTYTPDLFLRLVLAYLVQNPVFMDFVRPSETCLDTRMLLKIRKNSD